MVGETYVRRVREKLFRHMSSLDINYFEKNKTGVLVARLTSDMQSLNEFAREGAAKVGEGERGCASVRPRRGWRTCRADTRAEREARGRGCIGKGRPAGGRRAHSAGQSRRPPPPGRAHIERR